MIKNYLFYKQYEPAESQVAHLYEHLFIKRMERKLEAAGFPPDLVGYVNGMAFKDHLLELEAQFYTQEASDFFAKEIKKPEPSYSDKEIQAGIRYIEHEDMLEVKYNMEAIKKSLLRICNKPWVAIRDFTYQDFNGLDKTKNELIIQTKHNIKAFQSLHLSFELPSKNYGESSTNLVVFPRLSVMLLDVVAHQLNTLFHTYRRDSDVSDRFVYFTRSYINFTVSTSLTQTQITAAIQKSLERLKNPKHFKFIHDHLVNWASDDFLQLLTGMDYFRYTDILIGGKVMEELATQEKINEIVDSLRFKTKLIKPNLKRLAAWEAKQQKEANKN